MADSMDISSRKRPASEMASTRKIQQDAKLIHDEEQARKRPSVLSSNSNTFPVNDTSTANEDSKEDAPTFEVIDFERPQAPRHFTQLQDEDGDTAINDNLNSSDDMVLDNDEHAVGDGAIPRQTTTLLDQSNNKDGDDNNTSPSQYSSLGGKSLVQLQQSLQPQHNIDTPSTMNGSTIRKQTDSRPSRPDLRIFKGTSSIDNYEIMNAVGEGTFGLVTVGKDKRNEKVVALKKISMKNEKEGLPVTALREIKILKMMNHPNVIELIEIATKRADKVKNTRADVYMVFPYMDHDLSGIIESSSIKLSPSHVKSYLKQLLEGTAYLHQAKLLHRDMKTANILIDNVGNLKLADFGLARTYNPDERKRKYTNMVVTRWYRPPELILGETKYGPAVDIWGVGCVFGEMLRRQPILPGGGGKQNEEESSFDQLDKIFRLRGTPNAEVWPDWDKLPKWASFGGQFRNVYLPANLQREFHSDVRKERIDIDQTGLLLLAALLTLNPRLRPSAKDALTHPYFALKPWPARPGTTDFPKWEPSHEMDARKRRDQGRGGNIAVPMGGPAPSQPPVHNTMGGGPPMPPQYHQPPGGYYDPLNRSYNGPQPRYPPPPPPNYRR